MAVHNELGKNAEALARDWLMQQGYTVLETNWRHGHWEVDLIMLKENMPRFIEVKYRSSERFGPPELKVNKQKYRHLSSAAAAWLRRNPGYRDFRIDIVAITEHKNQEPEYFLIKNISL